MKIKAETPTSAQHSETGIDSSVLFACSTETGAASLVGFGAVMSGCVFDIFTVGVFGSGIIAMRAVSFLGPGDEIGGAFCARGGAGGGISGGSAIDSAIDGV